MSHPMKRRVTVLASVISVLLVASVAFAAWTANGAGDGYAEAGEHTALTTDAVATVASKLYPTKSADVKLTINNDNPYNVEVTEIKGSDTITSSVAACDNGGHGVTFANKTGSWTVPANGELAVTLTNAASMSNASVNACQSALFTIPVSLTGASAE